MARVWRFGVNDGLECNSDSKNCSEFILMECHIIKHYQEIEELDYKTREETNSRESFVRGSGI